MQLMPTFLYACEKNAATFGKLVAIVELEDDINSHQLVNRTVLGRILDEAKKDITMQFPESKYGVSRIQADSIDLVGEECEDRANYSFTKIPMSFYLPRVKREPCCPGL
jgi:hypothetical protein